VATAKFMARFLDLLISAQLQHARTIYCWK